MPDIKLSNGYCNECDRKVLALREIPKHPVWFLISVITGGLGLIVWIALAFRDNEWRCANCGSVPHKSK